MRAPAFWQAPARWQALLLSPFGALYGAVTAWRMARPGAVIRHEGRIVPVICVGNPVAGGAGKTPTAQAIARRLIARGERPFILSRGYGGTVAGPTIADPTRHTAREVGDEPLLHATVCPTVVAADRAAGARHAAAAGATVLVMDDGLQNPTLHKHVAIAVIDGGAGVGNGFCIPAGPLRAPLRAQAAHVHAVVSIGDGAAGEAAARLLQPDPAWHFQARLTPDPATIITLTARPFVAFAGIGRPEKFRDTLVAHGATPAKFFGFPDHHPFTPADIVALSAFVRKGLVLATTEKDAVRIAGRLPGLVIVPVRLSLPDDALDRLIDRAFTAAGR